MAWAQLSVNSWKTKTKKAKKKKKRERKKGKQQKEVKKMKFESLIFILEKKKDSEEIEC